MQIPEFVVKVANPYFHPPNSIHQPSKNLLKYATEYAFKNKIFPLFYEGCLKQGIQLYDEAHILMNVFKRRKKAQLDATQLLLDICEKHNLEIMFFKTFKPFNYIPDDIDLILHDESKLNLLIDLLEEYGYRLLKVGTPEVGMRKVLGGTFVDIDIHKWIASGHLQLFNVENLWRNLTYKVTDDGYKIPTFPECYEIVREAAYSLLKDFKVSVPGLYLAINTMKKGGLDSIKKLAKEENLLLSLYLYLGVAYLLTCKLFGSEAKLQLRYKIEDNSMMLLKLVRGDLIKKLRIPYPYSFIAIAWAYLSKAVMEIHRNRNHRVLLQLIKQPSSKGMDIFLDYIKEYFR